jgi:hypothetical protein
LLVGMQDRLRMWVPGTAFIATSALVYFLSMAAWLNLLLFVGMLVWVRVLIGLVALAGGQTCASTFSAAVNSAGSPHQERGVGSSSDCGSCREGASSTRLVPARSADTAGNPLRPADAAHP